MQVDKIYIITLAADDATAVEAITNKLNQLGLEGPTDYEIVHGHNGHIEKLPHGFGIYSNWNLGSATTNEWYQRDTTPGESGCAISHYNVWNKIIADGVDRALILEDDFSSIKPMSDLQYPDVDWDIAYLGRNALDAENEKSIDSSWVEPLSSYNTHSYIVTNNAANILVNGYNFTKNISSNLKY